MAWHRPRDPLHRTRFYRVSVSEALRRMGVRKSLVSVSGVCLKAREEDKRAVEDERWEFVLSPFFSLF